MTLAPNHRLNAGELEALVRMIEMLKRQDDVDREDLATLETAQAKLILQFELLL